VARANKIFSQLFAIGADVQKRIKRFFQLFAGLRPFLMESLRVMSSVSRILSVLLWFHLLP